MEQEIGSLTVGKRADITAVDLGHINAYPYYDIVSQLVYATQSHQVSDVWINGVPVLRNQQLLTIGLNDILTAAQQWQQQIQQQISP